MQSCPEWLTCGKRLFSLIPKKGLSQGDIAPGGLGKREFRDVPACGLSYLESAVEPVLAHLSGRDLIFHGVIVWTIIFPPPTPDSKSSSQCGLGSCGTSWGRDDPALPFSKPSVSMPTLGLPWGNDNSPVSPWWGKNETWSLACQSLLTVPEALVLTARTWWTRFIFFLF